ncbi:MAG: exodeoxyribonuclease III, partial [Acidobacteria bacterium]|nr:exodeoxyribonuclease III [Acidobacteriota bacterium]
MRIATWNVNGLRARMDFVAHWLESRAPDVVGLQELNLRDAEFTHEELAALGFRAVV